MRQKSRIEEEKYPSLPALILNSFLGRRNQLNFCDATPAATLVCDQPAVFGGGVVFVAVGGPLGGGAAGGAEAAGGARFSGGDCTEAPWAGREHGFGLDGAAVPVVVGGGWADECGEV
jgi:hypothetical protein